MVKTIEDHFSDWESNIFGYGYGSGEEHVVPALKMFLGAVPLTEAYDYSALEALLTPTITWLLINTLCHADIIEYGSSPRYGWLNNKGKRLQEFVASHTNDELIWFCRRTESYIPCYPDACNCGEGDFDQSKVCSNPFWR